QKPAHPGNPRVVLHLVYGPPRALFMFAFVGTGDQILHEFLMDLGVILRIHRTELKTLEWFAKLAQSFLLEEYWPLRPQLYGNRNHQKMGKQKIRAAMLRTTSMHL